jgi:DNA-binding NarL/FixJ family response regulator
VSELTRIAIVEDNEPFRRDLVSYLGDGIRFVVLGDYGNAEDAMNMLPQLAPQVVLMDINLPKASGIECVFRLKKQLPDTQFLMLTVYEETDTIFRALQAGATGYLLKRASPAKIVEAVLEIKQGGSPMTSRIARKVVESFKVPAGAARSDSELTPRESEILNLLAEGCAYKEIAARLDVSYSTVRTHVERVYQKLHVHSRAHAVAKVARR